MLRSLKWSSFEPDVIPAWLAEHDYRSHLMAERLAESRLERLRYGYLRLDELAEEARARAAEWLSLSGPTLDARNIRVCPGVTVGVSMVTASLTPPSSRILLGTPNFQPLESTIETGGREVIHWPMVVSGGRWSLDFDSLEQILNSSQPSALLLSNPNNPTGYSLTAADASSLLPLLSQHGVLLIVDEAMRDLVSGSTFGSNISENRAIRVWSCVKLHSLGDLRLALATFSSDEDAQCFDTFWAAHPWRPDADSLLLTLASLESAPEDVTTVRNMLEDDWAVFKQGLDSFHPLRHELPSEGLVGLLDLADLQLPDTELETTCLEVARVAARGPQRFAGGVRGTLRICVGSGVRMAELMALRLESWAQVSAR